MVKEKSEQGAQEEAPGKLLDNDTLRKLHGGELDFHSDLTTEQKSEFHNRFIEGDEEGIPTVEEEVEAAKVAAANPEAPVVPPETPPNPQTPPDPNVIVEPPEAESAESQELKQKLKTQRDANNTLQQRLDSANDKLRNLNESKVPTPPKIEDALDDNASKQDKWNRDVASKLNTHVDTQIVNTQKDKADTEKSLLYSSLSLLQTENPELRTSLPIETIDKTYVRFRDGLAGTGATNEQKNEAVDKFFSDAEFRKGKEGEGHVFPINDSDWKGYQTVSKIMGFKRTGGDTQWDSKSKGDKYSELDVAYYKYKKESGYIPDPVKQAALEAATQVADQVADNQSKPNLLSPEVGKSSEGIDGMTEAQAEHWLLEHPTPSTPEEVATLKAIMKKYSPSSAPQQPEVVF